MFRQACRDLGAVAAKASPDPVRLADRVFEAVTTNDYGEYDRLVEVILPALEGAGVARLKERLTAALAERPKPRRTASIPRPARSAAPCRTSPTTRATSTRSSRTRPRRRSPPAGGRDRDPPARGRTRRGGARLPRGRARRPSPRPGTSRMSGPSRWQEREPTTGTGPGSRRCSPPAARTRRSGSAGRGSRPASMPRTCAPTSRPCPTSRTWWRNGRRSTTRSAFPHFAIALSFLVEWKELREAARLVLERSREIDGNLYFVLDPAAKALEGKQPLAAVLLRRAMIEDTLEGAKATRYRHAARHLLECRALEPGHRRPRPLRDARRPSWPGCGRGMAARPASGACLPRWKVPRHRGSHAPGPAQVAGGPFARLPGSSEGTSPLRLP